MMFLYFFIAGFFMIAYFVVSLFVCDNYDLDKKIFARVVLFSPIVFFLYPLCIFLGILYGLYRLYIAAFPPKLSIDKEIIKFQKSFYKKMKKINKEKEDFESRNQLEELKKEIERLYLGTQKKEN